MRKTANDEHDHGSTFEGETATPLCVIRNIDTEEFALTISELLSSLLQQSSPQNLKVTLSLNDSKGYQAASELLAYLAHESLPDRVIEPAEPADSLGNGFETKYVEHLEGLASPQSAAAQDGGQYQSDPQWEEANNHGNTAEDQGEEQTHEQQQQYLRNLRDSEGFMVIPHNSQVDSGRQTTFHLQNQTPKPEPVPVSDVHMPTVKSGVAYVVEGVLSQNLDKNISLASENIVVLNRVQSERFAHWRSQNPGQSFEKFMDLLRRGSQCTPNLRSVPAPTMRHVPSESILGLSHSRSQAILNSGGSQVNFVQEQSASKTTTINPKPSSLLRNQSAISLPRVSHTLLPESLIENNFGLRPSSTVQNLHYTGTSTVHGTVHQSSHQTWYQPPAFTSTTIQSTVQPITTTLGSATAHFQNGESVYNQAVAAQQLGSRASGSTGGYIIRSTAHSHDWQADRQPSNLFQGRDTAPLQQQTHQIHSSHYGLSSNSPRELQPQTQTQQLGTTADHQREQEQPLSFRGGADHTSTQPAQSLGGVLHQQEYHTGESPSKSSSRDHHTLALSPVLHRPYPGGSDIYQPSTALGPVDPGSNVLVVEDFETVPEYVQKKIRDIAERNGAKPKVLLVQEEITPEDREMDDLMRKVYERVSHQV